jgi:hypothetical protein
VCVRAHRLFDAGAMPGPARGAAVTTCGRRACERCRAPQEARPGALDASRRRGSGGGGAVVGERRKFAGDGHLRTAASATKVRRRNRKQGRGIRCPRGARSHQRAQHVHGGAGGGRRRRNSAFFPPEMKKGTANLAASESARAQFVAPGGRARRGAPASALRAARGGLRRWRHVCTVGGSSGGGRREERGKLAGGARRVKGRG